MGSANRLRGRAGWPMVLAFIAAAGVGRAARAEDGAAPPQGKTEWYGWQTMASDGTAIALWTAAAYLNDARYTSSHFQTYDSLSNVSVVLGFSVYALGAPILHARRGNWDSFGGSLLVRLGLPTAGALAGALAGSASCSSGNEDEVPCPVVGGMFGIAAGGLAAMVIDSAVLAREPRKDERSAFVQPLVVPTSGGASFSLAGRF